MDDRTKYILLFIGGVIWAMRSSTKAYAPTLNVLHAGLEPERKPEGIEVEGGSCMSSFGPGYYEREGIENQKKWGKCLKCPTSWHIFPAGMLAGPPPQFDEDGIQIMYNKEHCKGITKLTGVVEVLS